MIGIVILNYRNWEDTKRCVESIFRNPPKDVYKIILVDNASNREPDFELSSFLEAYQIVFVRNARNLGYNAGNNVGIRLALELGCSHILLSNNDVCYLPRSIQTMSDYLSGHSKAGIVGPKILDRNGQVQKSNLCRKTGMKEKYMVRTRANILFRRQCRTYFGCDRDYEQIYRVYAVLGCCFMMSGRCAQAIMPLDEHPFLYEEELILGIRMEEQGFATVYHPGAVVRHLHGGSTRQQKAFAFAHNVRSEIYYCRKYLHAAKWQIYPLYLYRVLLYLARCFRYKDFRRRWRWFLKMTGEEFHVTLQEDHSMDMQPGRSRKSPEHMEKTQTKA